VTFEDPLQLPDGWTVATIPNLICLNGVLSDGDWIESKDQDPKGIVRLIQLADIGDGKYLNKSARFLTLEKARELNCTFLNEGDLLIARMPDPLGRVCIFPGDEKKSVTVVDVCIVRSGSQGIDHRWLMSVINSPKLRQEIMHMSSGTTRKRISKRNLSEMLIPVPPLNEQRRIVAKIEALKARSQRVKEELEAAHALENTLVAYYTTGWHEEELGKHIEERKELAGEYWHKYPVVGLSNEGQITERREPIGQKTAHKCKVIRQGDIVFNPIRFSIGSIARYRGTEPAIVSSEYQVFRTKSTVSAELLCRYLRTKQGQSRLEIETQGSVRYRVYFHNLQRLVMPIASPERQAEAEQFFVCLNKTFKVVDQAMSKIPQLEQAILTKAFRGELVPQDPNDEPASVLLERIRAEREKLDTKKKAKGKTEKKSRKAKPEPAEPEQLSLPGFE
jgi:type I restriction enzyme S subunit